VKRTALILLVLFVLLSAVGAVAAQVAVDCINLAGYWYRCNDLFVSVVFGG
jgi:hypothetical protein